MPPPPALAYLGPPVDTPMFQQLKIKCQVSGDHQATAPTVGQSCYCHSLF